MNYGECIMAKKENKNTITVEQSHKLGFELTYVIAGLLALRHQANTLMRAKHAGADNGLLRLETANFLETVFDMVEIYSDELDRVACYLLECDNPDELRAYEEEEKGE
ncbi:hypothetical protein J7U03_04425 [Streptococcus thermophilus]